MKKEPLFIFRVWMNEKGLFLVRGNCRCRLHNVRAQFVLILLSETRLASRPARSERSSYNLDQAACYASKVICGYVGTHKNQSKSCFLTFFSLRTCPELYEHQGTIGGSLRCPLPVVVDISFAVLCHMLHEQ